LRYLSIEIDDGSGISEKIEARATGRKATTLLDASKAATVG
jgi:hypothetical protein